MIRDVNARSEVGLKRETNQDAVFSAIVQDIGLFVVADGMGGHYGGEMASRMAISEIASWWKKTSAFLASITFFEVVEVLEKEIRKINNHIVEQYRLLDRLGGTTFCALLIHHNAYAVFNIGDSRLYCCEKRKLKQLTRDDIWENTPEIQKISADIDISNDKRCGKLTKAMGIEADIAPSLICNSINRQMVFLVCSDGAYKHVQEKEVRNALKKVKKYGDTMKCNEYLIKKTYEDGASDNVSMITILVDNQKLN